MNKILLNDAFESHRAIYIPSRNLTHEVQKYFKETEKSGTSVLTIRHTIATHHVANKTSLRTVQEALGNEDLKTTSEDISLAKEVVSKKLQEHAL